MNEEEQKEEIQESFDEIAPETEQTETTEEAAETETREEGRII